MAVIVAYQLLLGWLPLSIQLLILGIFSIVLVILVFKIIALVLDAIPFL